MLTAGTSDEGGPKTNYETWRGYTVTIFDVN